MVDFSLRRTQGAEAGMQAARIARMVGFAGTSSVAGAVSYDIHGVGTMAHSYVEAFASEDAAFAAFASAHPGPVTFLVDTYDVLGGVQAAIRTIRQLGLPATCGVRLGSGDLGSLSRQTRAALDAAGLREANIVLMGVWMNTPLMSWSARMPRLTSTPSVRRSALAQMPPISIPHTSWSSTTDVPS